MDKRKAHIILSWLLLLFFAVGQFVIYAHQHHTKANRLIVKAHGAAGQQIVHEKCNLCDQMHHVPIQIVQPLHYAYHVSPAVKLYIHASHHYKANALIHADGLSPPASV